MEVMAQSLVQQIQKLEAKLMLFPQSFPKQIQLFNLRSTEYALTQPISVLLEEDQEQYVATFFDTGDFGVGETEQEAIDDLCSNIIAEYESLRTETAKLGQLPAQTWAFLSGLIRKRGNPEKD
ncbi:hypothetical protein FJZ31_37330 [Candidatus Poribacteria bacterium]|nr:hypothetical protein [Candidatus Poribacteria bacterium]